MCSDRFGDFGAHQRGSSECFAARRRGRGRGFVDAGIRQSHARKSAGLDDKQLRRMKNAERKRFKTYPEEGLQP
jgi:hypothetical protein